MLNHLGEFSNSMMIDIPRNQQNRIISRINNFHIIYIHDPHQKRNRLKHYAKDIVNGKKNSIPLFSNKQEGETFIISEASYNQNKELFRKLRLKARDDVFNRIATGISSYFLSEYSNLIQESMSQNPRLKDLNLLDIPVKKINSLLKNNTFLAEEEVWDTFYNWFKDCLTSHVVKQMVQEFGEKELKHMDQEALNEAFRHRFMQQVRMDSPLMVDFIKIIEQYLKQWMKKIIPSLDEKPLSNSQLESFLEMKSNKIKTTVTNIGLPLDITNSHLSVMSNAVYHSVRETLSNRSFRKKKFTPWPTVQIRKRTVEGTIQIKPFGSEERLNETSVHESWEQAEKLSELVVDVLDALCSFFLSNASHHQDIIEIRLNDLLAIRGLKSKKSGNGRRGGYEPEQVNQILKALTVIQNIWVELDKVVIYEKGKPKEVELYGRTFTFFNKHYQISDVQERDTGNSLIFAAGEVFKNFLHTSNRQIALLPLKALQYNPHQEQWEKKLIRYLSWRWRTQARKSDYQQPYRIGSLLQAIGIVTNQRTPSRTRDRLEEALDKLQVDGLIGSWEYLDWEESIADANGWARLWENTKLVITPNETVKEQYQSISRKGSSHNVIWQKSNLGNQLKETRKKMGLTLMQMSEELELSAAYVSTIERGKRIPSSKVSNRILKWIHYV